MEGQMNINIGEGIPLQPTKTTNVFVTSSTQKNIGEGISMPHKGKTTDINVHINTFLTRESVKKIKICFFINLFVSIVSVIFTCLIAFYYWNTMISMKKELSYLRYNLEHNNLNKEEASPLSREQDFLKEEELKFSEGMFLSSRPVHSVPKREEYVPPVPSNKQLSPKGFPQEISGMLKEPLIAHFYGDSNGRHNSGNTKILGPWKRDTASSSPSSETQIQLNTSGSLHDHIVIQAEGLYLVYAQLVYESHSPSCFHIMGRHGSVPRQLATCATADFSTEFPLERSQLSCSVQTVARLYEGDIVNIALREPNKTLLFKNAYSYFGFIKLSS